MGSLLYSQGCEVISLNSNPVVLAQSMLHTMNLAVKHSANDDNIIVGKNVISAQKHFIYNKESIYFNGGFIGENSETNLLNLQEIIIKGIYQSIFYCLVMLNGYKSIFSSQENDHESLSKKFKVINLIRRLKGGGAKRKLFYEAIIYYEGG